MKKLAHEMIEQFMSDTYSSRMYMKKSSVSDNEYETEREPTFEDFIKWAQKEDK